MIEIICPVCGEALEEKEGFSMVIASLTAEVKELLLLRRFPCLRDVLSL